MDFDNSSHFLEPMSETQRNFKFLADFFKDRNEEEIEIKNDKSKNSCCSICHKYSKKQKKIKNQRTKAL